MELEFFTRTAGLSALAVVGVQQVLKLKFIPVAFANRYPVPTNILLSVLVSLIVVWKSSLEPVVWQDWLLLIATVSVVAGIVYNTLFRNWNELRATEGAGK
jgi:hypothetical protein